MSVPKSTPRAAAAKSGRPRRAPAPRRPITAPRPEADDAMPAAGPHAKPHLTDPDRTPGTGALPDPARPRDPDATG